MGGGVASIDFDGDGWLDLFFTDGRDYPNDENDRRHRARLFRNRGGSFEEMTDAARLDDFAYGQGCTVGDYDNDGFDDLFVTHFGATALFRNNGDGTFDDVTTRAGAGCSLWSTACAFGDLAGHGSLDLVVTGYLEVDPAIEPTCRDRRGTPTYCGPQHFEGQSYRLFQNDGAGGFADVSEAAGVVMPHSKGLAVAILDFDVDGRLDVFVVNDAEPARLFRNVGECRFAETGLTIEIGLCPSDLDRLSNPEGHINYAGCSGSSPRLFNDTATEAGRLPNGLFGPVPDGGIVRFRDIKDGLSLTAAFSEKVKGIAVRNQDARDLLSPPASIAAMSRPNPDTDPAVTYNICRNLNPLNPSVPLIAVNNAMGSLWWSGHPFAGRYNHVMPPNSWSCGFGLPWTGNNPDNGGGAYTASSRHPGSVTVLMADGQVRSVSDNVDLKIWWAIATHSGIEAISNNAF